MLRSRRKSLRVPDDPSIRPAPQPRPRRSQHPFAAFAAASLLSLLLAPARAGAQDISLVRVAEGLQLPVFASAPPGDLERLFIIERGLARIMILRDGAILPTPFLDLGPVAVLPINANDERGVLGLAFSPKFSSNREFFVHYNDKSGKTIIERFRVSVADPDVAETASSQIVLEQSQPFPNHNGGSIEFGPDGFLYIGLGDGGAANDPGNRAQDGTTLLGKLLRIDPRPAGGQPFRIPEDNPFTAANDPSDLVRDEIWALGLRNPWRFSFDRKTGDLYLGDVGQNQIEEIDIEVAGSGGGQNYGWRLKEGSQCFDPPSLCDPGGLTDPVHEYTHDGGNCAVTGGHVYRGCAIPELRGTYFFADFCTSRIWSFVWDGASVTNFAERTEEIAPAAPQQIDFVSSFGEDGRGELYVVDMGTGIDGEVYKLVPGGVDRVCQDAVVGPVAPLELTIPSGQASSARPLKVRVANGDELSGAPAGSEIVLVASDGTCPAGTVAGLPDFGAAQAGVPDRVLLAAGRGRTARIPIQVSSADFATTTPKALPRCLLDIHVGADAHDPALANDSIAVELSVRDRNDAAQPTSNETAVRSGKPVRMRIGRGVAAATRVIRVTLENGDVVPEPARPGHLITLAGSDGDCPAGTIAAIDTDRTAAGDQSSVLVAGGKRAVARVSLLVANSDFETRSAKSPARCTIELSVIGPGGDSESSNDTTRIPIDVIDRNDF